MGLTRLSCQGRRLLSWRRHLTRLWRPLENERLGYPCRSLEVCGLGWGTGFRVITIRLGSFCSPRSHMSLSEACARTSKHVSRHPRNSSDEQEVSPNHLPFLKATASSYESWHLPPDHPSVTRTSKALLANPLSMTESWRARRLQILEKKRSARLTPAPQRTCLIDIFVALSQPCCVAPSFTFTRVPADRVDLHCLADLPVVAPANRHRGPVLFPYLL